MTQVAESLSYSRILARVISRSLIGLGLLLLVAASADAATNLWWDDAYQQRFNIEINTGELVPDKGYDGYTARIDTLDTATLIAAGDMQPDCSDLRILFFDGLGWTELPRHVLGCNSATTDIRFMISADIAASSSDDNYYLYYDNPAPGPLPAMNETNVYLWYDDAQTNRISSYTRGRVDPWHGTGWDDSLVYLGNTYRYDNGDNFTSGYRIPVDERDVYIETEFRHERCYPLNITTGLLVRGAITSGFGGGESSDNYYASNRGEFPNQGGPNSACTSGGYTHDGSIIKNERTNIVVTGPNPDDVIRNRWRRQGLAAWSVAPTSLAFWDEDDTGNWAALGYPSPANLQVQGTDAVNENTNRGFAAIMTAQDRGRFRGILIRRYISPEPSLVLTPAPRAPVVLLNKSALTVFDPVNTVSNAKAIPGSWVEYTLVASNSGSGASDPDSLVVTEPLPANVAMFVGDLTGPNTGPVEFIDGTGSAASGLSYIYGGLGDLSDSLEFSTDGVSWNYIPTGDAQDFDAAVRFLRVRPVGSFAPADSGTDREFSLRFRVQVR